MKFFKTLTTNLYVNNNQNQQNQHNINNINNNPTNLQ